MKFLVVGFGAIGRRHVRNVRNLWPGAAVTVWRRAGQADAPVVHTLEDALATEPGAAIIATPAASHVPTALELVKRGIPVCIEKPLSHHPDGVAELIETAKLHGAPLMVAYPFRFHAGMASARDALLAGRIGRLLSLRAEVGQYLPDWRPGQDYRDAVSSSAALGGGAVLELSHELDYALWLGGAVESVTARVNRVSSLEMDAEDCAEIILGFRSGASAAIHLDMFQRPAARQCRLSGESGSIIWTPAGARIWEADRGDWTDLGPSEPEDMYLAELRHFAACAASRTTPAVTAEDGLRALDLVMAVKQSSTQQRTVWLQ